MPALIQLFEDSIKNRQKKFFSDEIPKLGIPKTIFFNVQSEPCLFSF
jgi:hypothetical protein